MKKILGIIGLLLVFLPIVFVSCVYVAIRYQYKDTFMPGVFVNHVYTGDLTPEAVNDKLIAGTQTPDFTVTDIEGNRYVFSLEEASFSPDYMTALSELHREQSVLSFVKWFAGQSNSFEELSLEPVITYDKEKLSSYLDEQVYLRDNSDPKDKIVAIRKGTDGYYLYDETKNLLSHEKAVQAIEKAIDAGIYEADLQAEGCYTEITRTPQMEETYQKWNDLSRYMETAISYEIGNHTETIGAAQISDFIAVDENGAFLYDESGSFYVDEEKVKAFVHALSEEYNTVNKPRNFHATRGDVVEIATGTYGTKIDEKAETEYLLGAAGRGCALVREPVYLQRSFTGETGFDDIGKTYIEVDMTDQMMYYYENGKQKLSTPVVTGNTSLGRGTPQKVCYVYYKQRDRILRGEDYATPVKYWMAVYGNIGIHDASWRGKFGGSIYRSNGSHGCINTPTKEVSKLYEMVEIGTPVIIFY